MKHSLIFVYGYCILYLSIALHLRIFFSSLHLIKILAFLKVSDYLRLNIGAAFELMPDIYLGFEHGRGETLTSISKLYGVPVLEIADSNKEIADVNLVFEGQRLQIPSAVAESSQLVSHFYLHCCSFVRFLYFLE